jgi:hypothetical protein
MERLPKREWSWEFWFALRYALKGISKIGPPFYVSEVFGMSDLKKVQYMILGATPVLRLRDLQS